MALASDMLREFLVGIAFEINKASQQQAKRAIQDVEQESARYVEAEKRHGRDLNQEYKRRALDAEDMAKRIGSSLNTHLVAGFRNVALAIATVATAIGGIRAIKDTIDETNKLSRAAREAHTTAEKLSALGKAYESIGSSKDVALGTIQAISQAIKENSGNLSYLRALGVTETKDSTIQLQQLGRELRRIAKDSKEDVARLHASRLGLSFEMTTQLLSGEFEKALVKAEELRKRWGVNTDELAKSTNALREQLSEQAGHFDAFRQKLAGVITPFLISVAKNTNTFFDRNAKQISEGIDAIGKSLSEWSETKGRQFSEWLEAVVRDPETQRAAASAWREIKTAADELGAALKDAFSVKDSESGVKAFFDSVAATIKTTREEVEGIVSAYQSILATGKSVSATGGRASPGITGAIGGIEAPQQLGPPSTKESVDKFDKAVEKFDKAQDDKGQGGVLSWLRRGLLNFFTGGGDGSGQPGGFIGQGGSGGSGGGGAGGGGGFSGGDRGGFEGNPAGRAPVGKWWNKDRIGQAVEYLKKNAGLPELGAKALVARWAGVEAGGGPESVNPRSGAVGIAQWLGNRKANTPSDFEGQLAKAVEELNTTETKAKNKLMTAKTPGEAATGASMFERAEGYNPATGTDNFTGKTVSIMRGMEAAGADAQAVRTSNYVKELQVGASGKTRNRPITDELRGILDAAGAATGLQAEVHSGGQDSHGFRRRGSHRHDIQPGTIGAADLDLLDPKTGRKLIGTDERDRARMFEYVKEATKGGATGFGYGPEYMGPSRLHVGGGNAPGDEAATWGSGKSWLRDAYQEGIRARMEQNSNKMNGGAAAGGGTPLSSGPVSNDNSRKVNQTNSFNTTIQTNDPAVANSMYKRSNEQLAGMASGQLKTAIR